MTVNRVANSLTWSIWSCPWWVRTRIGWSPIGPGDGGGHLGMGAVPLLRLKTPKVPMAPLSVHRSVTAATNAPTASGCTR